MLDVISSDAATLGPCSIQNKPFDPSHHGLSISIPDLTALKVWDPRLSSSIQ